MGDEKNRAHPLSCEIDPNHCQGIAKIVFNAYVELNDETWPVFEHFISLLTDPFVYIRSQSLYFLKDVFSSLPKAMNPDRDRLECKQLNFGFDDGSQNSLLG
ncbi:hypothetical protein DdX_19861 [Ditylenchus destructor]|uniref:Uncharacterized protein n=1 Tax=Ditylenchus destructor TaxID=166010 RepID=A0AAD4MJ06_9BILA|nr:hypothetical protein DdX_19861 [Ditylenchus destructor]